MVETSSIDNKAGESAISLDVLPVDICSLTILKIIVKFLYERDQLSISESSSSGAMLIVIQNPIAFKMVDDMLGNNVFHIF